MKLARFIILLIAVFLVSSGTIFAESISVKAGGKVRLTGWSHFDTRCKFTGYSSFRASSKLKYGNISILKGKINIRRVSDSKYKKCIGKKLKGVIAYYKAGKKTGKERFTLIRINKNGRQKNKIRYKVTIY